MSEDKGSIFFQVPLSKMVYFTKKFISSRFDKKIIVKYDSDFNAYVKGYLEIMTKYVVRKNKDKAQ